MANLRTEYAIEIIKRGTGAPEAVRDFQSVQAAAVATNAATAAMGTTAAATGTQVAANASKMRVAASALSGEIRLLALIAFPQFAQQAMLTGLALNTTAASAKLLGVSAVGLGGGLTILAGSIWIVIERMRLWKAELEETNTRLELGRLNLRLYETLQRSISDSRDAGTISAERAVELSNALFATRRLRGSPNEESKALLEIQQALRAVNAVTEESIELRQRLTLATTEGYNRRRAEIDFNHRALLLEIMAEERRTGIRRDDLTLEADRAEVAAIYAADREALAARENVWDKLHAGSLSEQAVQLQQLNRLYDGLRMNIEDLARQGVISPEEKIQMEKEWSVAIENSTAKLKAQQFATSEWGRIATAATQEFASGFSSAVVGAFSEGGDAFRKFAQQFLQQMAQMLIQAVLLRAIFSALGGGSIATAITGIKPSALGGIYPRQMAAGGIAGVALASASVYLPKFNVEVGEAAPEWLTVLRSPRMMQVGGVRAAVGFAGNEELALSRAGDLRGAGAGGTIVIEVQHSPETEVDITRNSVQGAVVQINNNLRQDTDTSRAVKGLVT